MKNLPIIVKFLGLMGVFGAFTFAVTLYSGWQISGIAAGFEAVEHGAGAAAVTLSLANQRFSSIMADMEFQQIASLPADDTTAANDLTADRADFDQAMDSAIQLSPAHAGELASLKSRGDTLVDTTCAHSEALGNAAHSYAQNAVAQGAFLSECAPVFPAITAAMRNERQALRSEADNDDAKLTADSRRLVWETFAVVLAGLAGVITLGFLSIRRWIATPILGLQRQMAQLAGGALETAIAGLERRDEIGSMARAVQVFKQNGLEKQALEQQAKLAADREHVEQARRVAEGEAAAAQQAAVLEGVADGLARLAAGDLLFRLNRAFAPEYEKLRGDFNNAVQTLQDTIRAIAANAQAVRSGAGEITQASDDLSRRTEQQAASLEETAAALDQITATVRKTARGANEARDVVATARTDAERSGAVVTEAVTAMNGIEDSSRQIANIIGVIDEIAFQTNLLALNAGIEAARAGDAGRGFAVVATEVRALAQRSADAAKEIKGLISASASQVETGVDRVGETGRTLTRIVEQVNRLSGLVSDIAGAAQEQASGLAEVNIAVNQMDQVTQQNAAMVEQSTAASHALSSESEELTRLVGQFRTGDAAQSVAVSRLGSKAALPQVAAKRPVTAPKLVAVAGPATATAEGWAEF